METVPDSTSAGLPAVPTARPATAADPVAAGGPPAVHRVSAPRSLRGLLGVDPKAPARAEIPNDRKLLQRRISRMVHKAAIDFDMLADGDRVMVCMSGGKDSYALLHFLQQTQARSPIRFEIIAVHLAQGHPGFPLDKLEDYLKACGSPYHIEHYDTYTVVKEMLQPGKTTCSLCSRLRRGILYDTAKRLGCNKVALGHHRDDILATLMLNLFFCGQLKAMPAKLRADDGYNTVIRPLAYVPESWIVAFKEFEGWPVIPCSLCSQQPDQKRTQMEQLLAEIDRTWPGSLPSALHAVQNLHPRFLLDRAQWDFDAVPASATGDADEDAFE